MGFIVAAQPMMDRESAAEGNSTLKRRIRIRTRGQLEEAPDRDDTQIRTEQSDTTRQRKPTAQHGDMRGEEEEHVARIVVSPHTSLFVLYEPPSLWSACCLIRSERSNEHARRCLEDEGQRADSGLHEQAHVRENISMQFSAATGQMSMESTRASLWAAGRVRMRRTAACPADQRSHAAVIMWRRTQGREREKRKAAVA